MSKPCSVCKHMESAAINAQLIEGATLGTLAEAYGLSVTALHRHKALHIPELLEKARTERAAEEAAGAESLLDRVMALDAKASSIYKLAVKSKHLATALAAVKELREITQLWVRLAGDVPLSSSPVVEIVVSPRIFEKGTESDEHEGEI